MTEQYSERAFETYIEEALFSKNSWAKGSKQDWDQENALFPNYIFDFIRRTQPDLWDRFEKMHSSNLESLIIETLIKELDTKGTMPILRHGFKFYGEAIKMAFFMPSHGLNEEAIELYNANTLHVTRQVFCHPFDKKTIDLAFSINGLPVATCELKNPMTGQTWRNAVRQYKVDREPNAPLFRFQKRAIVHFAVDTEEVYMATELKKDSTRFLPFNRGSDPGNLKCGAGNPQHHSGHRTGYFWEEILAKDTFLDIFGKYIFIEEKEEKYFDRNKQPRTRKSKKIIFPRFHQLNAVAKLVAKAREEGVGQNYLVQHSAGSGKTKSISWLSHRLSSLHDEEDNKIFDCVLVITDRQVLDRQLQNAIYQIEHAQGVVRCIDQDSKQLAEALVDGTKIVVTTLQKFPFVLRGLLKLAGQDGTENVTEEQKKSTKQWERKISQRKYAVIVDEAHSSQSGESARELKEILGDSEQYSDDDLEQDWEDRINQVIMSRGQQRNLSFFAFTATPKGKTLEIFGRQGLSGKKEAFHLYSMRQAIEEEFILDVVKNYTTYDVYLKLIKSRHDDPAYSKKKTLKKLLKFASLHSVNVAQKTEIIVEHFKNHVMHHLNGQAKAMVTTPSRLHAVRYMHAFQKYLSERGYDKEIKPLVAFSGTVKDNGISYTEPSMNKDADDNPISESQLPEKFASPDYNILLVANKYQTGFDQPLLYAMYVDKKLSGVQAVQTLSRLNRKIPGKEAPFVLDFVNKSQEIYEAFKPYYDVTSLQEESDHHQLEKLKFELDEAQIYHLSEIEGFAKIFYKLREKQEPNDHARLNNHLNPAIDRFKVLKDEDKDEFKNKLSSYVKLYSFISQIMPYGDPNLEKLFSYGKCLLPKLQLKDSNEVISLGDDIALQYFRIQRSFSGAIDLRGGEDEGVKPPIDVGGGKDKDEKAPLSDIIEVINEKFSTNFTEEDRLFFQQIQEKAAHDEKILETAKANPFDKFKIGIKSIIEDVMIERMDQNDKIVTKYLEDKEFQNIVFSTLAESIFKKIHEKA